MGRVGCGSVLSAPPAPPAPPALAKLPEVHPRPPEFQALRDATWAELGAGALTRYEEIVAVWEAVAFPEPHLHINMLGTRRSHAERGYGRRILEAVQEASRRRPATVGVSLTTEDPNNVPMYEHCGYRVIHHARATESLETWLLFRPNELDTDRLTLRWATEADAPFFLELLNDADWIRYIGDRGVKTLEAARGYVADKLTASYVKHGFGLYVAVEKPSGDPVGICGLIRRAGLEDVDVGFAMLPRFRGKGYALEATRAVMDLGRDVFGLRRLVAITIPDNRGSIRVLERAGLTYERTIRLPDDDCDLALYGCGADR